MINYITKEMILVSKVKRSIQSENKNENTKGVIWVKKEAVHS